jgi:predicted DNA-binding transcriptional regulator AlpA
VSAEGSSGSGGDSGNVVSINRPHVDEAKQDQKPEPLVTALEVAEHFGCSESQVYKQALNPRIPQEERLPSFLLWGRLRRFRLSEVEAWLKTQRARPGSRGSLGRRRAA